MIRRPSFLSMMFSQLPAINRPDISLLSLLILVLCRSPVFAQTEEPSLLPFTSSDQVVVRMEGSPRTRTISGVIEDMTGQNIVFRRNGNTIDVFKLSDVVSLRFQKSTEFDDGLRKLRSRDWKPALSALQSAAAIEPRQWVLREIQSAIAQSQRALGQFEECLATVEKILKEDSHSRHVVELPLVWDERLLSSQRIQLDFNALQSPSPARRLTAASALLQDPTYQKAASAVLQSQRKELTGTLQDLAETQLWRLRLIMPNELRESEIDQWNQRVRFLDKRTRSGPEFLIGRALLLTHDYDNAATSLLWMPLLEPLDPWTNNACMSDAITALDLSGRTQEAARLRLEWPDLPSTEPAKP